VNLPIIMHAKLFTKLFCLGFTIIMYFPPAQGDWKIDLSRRVKKKRQVDIKDNTLDHFTEVKVFDWFANQRGGGRTSQELVVLNTEKGFIPGTIRLREGGIYKIHVVNVNEKEKNVSFILDPFSEYHATYFGKIKSFTVSPKKEGIFSFVCPETSAQGKLVVYPLSGTSHRRPASEE